MQPKNHGIWLLKDVLLGIMGCIPKPLMSHLGLKISLDDMFVIQACWNQLLNHLARRLRMRVIGNTAGFAQNDQIMILLKEELQLTS